MSIESTKLELIRIILDTQSEELLERAMQFLKEEEREIDASQKAPSLSKEETELFLKINEGLPEEVQMRYNELLEKLADESITEEEHQELIQLISQVEAKNAERLKHLAQLARLWNTSLREVMERLGIKPPGILGSE